jgi:hypothetical protein
LPELIEAARSLPALLTALVEREHERLRPAPAAPDAGELRAALERSARRREVVTLGAALLLGALVWLALGRSPAWLGWALLAAGAAGIVYAQWRTS